MRTACRPTTHYKVSAARLPATSNGRFRARIWDSCPSWRDLSTKLRGRGGQAWKRTVVRLSDVGLRGVPLASGFRDPGELTPKSLYCHRMFTLGFECHLG